jgi:hypothetical protein
MYKIKLYERNVYGKIMMYFREQNEAEIFKILTGQKTISMKQVKAMECFGVTFEIEKLPENVK